MSVAVVTGGSTGLGAALARGLAEAGWSVVVDARHADELAASAAVAGEAGTVVAVAGDVTDAAHRRDLVAAAAELGGLDLVVNNAGTLGVSPLPPLADYPLDQWRDLYEVNVHAPLALLQEALPALRRSPRAAVVNVTSDAAVEPYAGWGAYGSAKAALEQLTAILGVEEPEIRVWAVDPGDLRTRMHQAAFPGEDISDRPLPESVVPALVDLVRRRPPSGRYRLAELALPAEVEP
jgi:NAD(P)-dependent dehydrogenase (short-subunit alcohol dehydrogenase family)